MHDPQPISDRPVGLGFLHRVGRFRPGGSPFSSPGCRNCKGIEGLLIREWESILPGVRWLFVRSPASQRPARGAGVSTPCGRFRPGESPFSSPRCWSCRSMEGLLNRGWGPILPVCREIVGFPRGATSTARASPPDWPTRGERRSSPRPMRLGLRKRWEGHLTIILYLGIRLLTRSRVMNRCFQGGMYNRAF